jgi:hypothetical protein
LKNYHFAFKSVIAPDPGPSGLNKSGTADAGIGIIIPEGEDSPEGMQMLANMMAALQFDLNKDTCVVVCPKAPQSLHLPALIRGSRIKVLLLFGIQPETLGICFPLALHNAIRHQETVFLLTHSIAELLAEKARDGKVMRGALWNCLKQIFVV